MVQASSSFGIPTDVRKRNGMGQKGSISRALTVRNLRKQKSCGDFFYRDWMHDHAVESIEQLNNLSSDIWYIAA